MANSVEDGMEINHQHQTMFTARMKTNFLFLLKKFVFQLQTFRELTEQNLLALLAIISESTAVFPSDTPSRPE